MSRWCEFDSREALDKALAEHLAQRLAQEIRAQGAASLAVSGGSTPKGMFAQLAAQDIPWEQVWVTLVDERWVAPDDADSNERLVRENLLVAHAARARFVGLKTTHAQVSDGLAEATARLAPLPRPITCVVLGMGGDGHTASWFPQAGNLAQLLDPAGKDVLGRCDPVTAPHERITLTLPVVLQSREIIVHITGADKRAVLDEAVDKRYPIAAVTAQTANPATIWWAP
ncbi:6-phosphogluconolactonase [Mangrovimicrobium sediminis]|uniref:6-phosphogluconolactonase n=1 Tax=Mangrovimicrobium sediminis TaxID=2562682 RepID=A0A4Z0M8G5_9GAMM|nr:6-phosphogluconolactonase [Haliea sp. SAOS-164]TGD75809.1 6-phosphogluconolactonase [Haliea sp. SAOS-164]